MQCGFTWTANGDKSCHFILFYTVGGSSIQSGVVDDSKANFFPNIVASPSVHIATIGSFGW